MTEPTEISHPSLKQFKSALDTKKVGRALMESFDKWRSNPAKCEPEGELKGAADALWTRFQTEMNGKPAAPSGAAQNPIPRPTEKPRGGKGDRGGQGRGGFGDRGR